MCEADRNKSERKINVIKGPEIKSYIHLKLTEKVHVGVGSLHFDSKGQEIERGNTCYRHTGKEREKRRKRRKRGIRVLGAGGGKQGKKIH